MGWWRSPRGMWGWWLLNWCRGWLELIDLTSLCCVSLCLLRSTFLWKDLPHKSHENGLYPVCFLLCVIRLLLWLNALPQTMHLWGLSPEEEQNTINHCCSNEKPKLSYTKRTYPNIDSKSKIWLLIKFWNNFLKIAIASRGVFLSGPPMFINPDLHNFLSLMLISKLL